ncbi:aminoglycoside phosphotransferase family protein [Raoultella sp. HC6]|uniref:aminoglycoside phosphotransferase family protein n=1 Tax=Raoultella sp. HC6 TaxID=2923366 RepID=UPI001F50EBD6|nr:aminoglycoside phosphotransferase family protein [Raoultella sp. HC6]
MFSPWLSRWALIPDGEPVMTHTSQLLPVLTAKEGMKAMLKLTADSSERTGCELMAWWDGRGAAQALAHEPGALLLARATGEASLSVMSRTGEDERACRIVCEVASRLHVPPAAAMPKLTPLESWFGDLEPAARTHGGILIRCAAVAKALLSAPRDIVVLHGDLHHGNILDFAACGWLAIDPKGLIGERGFDFANIFTNPDLADPATPVAVRPEIFQQRLRVVTEQAELDRQRLLMWIVAWCGLSSAWFLDSGEPAPVTLRVAEMALAELER